MIWLSALTQKAMKLLMADSLGSKNYLKLHLCRIIDVGSRSFRAAASSLFTHHKEPRLQFYN